MRMKYAIVFVSDMERSTAFYRDALGMPLQFQSPHWTEFATEGASLALHLADGGGKPDAEAAGSCRPGLSVPDLAAFHAKMLEQRVPCTQVPTPLFGALIAQYLDPDGLPISVSEERSAR